MISEQEFNTNERIHIKTKLAVHGILRVRFPALHDDYEH